MKEKGLPRLHDHMQFRLIKHDRLKNVHVNALSVMSPSLSTFRGLLFSGSFTESLSCFTYLSDDITPTSQI